MKIGWEGNVKHTFEDNNITFPYGIQKLWAETFVVCYINSHAVLRLSSRLKKREIVGLVEKSFFIQKQLHTEVENCMLVAHQGKEHDVIKLLKYSMLSGVSKASEETIIDIYQQGHLYFSYTTNLRVSNVGCTASNCSRY